MSQVDIRLVGALESVTRAVAQLERVHGGAVVFQYAPRQGRRGEWLCYGTLMVQTPAPAPTVRRRIRKETGDE